MPSPFPGMDPYLEMPPFWGDFCPRLLGAIGNSLLDRLLPRYDVRIEEYLLLLQDDERLRRVQPDVSVMTTPVWQPSGGTAVAEAASVELEYPDFEPQTQRRLAIVRQADSEVVTVLEVLSPINKTVGADAADAYRGKRNELIASRINLVELDLLRGGQRLPMRGSLPDDDYYVFVGRGEQRPRCEVIGWKLVAPLPKIPIPLEPGDDEAVLDLAEVFRSTYDAAFYDRRLPYSQPLSPEPTADQATWIQERLDAK